jgi:hypothetical protein
VRLKNKSRYNGRDISGLFRTAAITLGEEHRVSRLTVEVVLYHPRKHYADADLGEPTRLKLLDPEKLWKNPVDALAARTAERDVPPAALANICQMVQWIVTKGRQGGVYGGSLPRWAKGRRIRVAPPKDKPERLKGLDYHRDKLKHEQEKLEEWEAELEHAERFVKKYRKMVRSREGTIRRLKKKEAG